MRGGGSASRALFAGVVLLALAGAGAAAAHPLAPALLEIRESPDGRAEVTWKQPRVRPRGAWQRPLLPPACEPRSAATLERGAGSVTERWSVDCGAAGLVGRRIAVEGLATGGTDVLVRLELADGRHVQRVLRASESSFQVPARARRLDVARGYLALGAEHILGGLDHLLFVLGLLLLVSGTRALVRTVTAFSVGHSVTLSVAALGFVRFPPRPIELLIALSVFALAVELARPGTTPLRRRPWIMAFGFGLLHGLGFAGALAEAGLPSQEIPLALLSFNAGIEAGQLGFVALVLLARRALRGVRAPLPAWTRGVPVYVLGSLAAFWCFERAAALLP